MADLVERYVHQVGRYLPPKERAEIEAELRSQIQDQLDDRFEGTPAQADIVTVLAELGHPYQMAASYNRDQYLIGPDLYPYMTMVLRYVWVIVPTVVLFLNIFGALTSSQPSPVVNVLFESLFAAVQTTFVFFGVVVLLFAFIQRISAELEEEAKPFNPLELPEVDDPYVVDRVEAIFGLAFGAFFMLILLYFLRVGGLTLRFNLSDPGEVNPVPLVWMILLIIAVFAMTLLQLLMLRRNRWSVGLWLFETVLEVIAPIFLYFAILVPAFEPVIAANPVFTNAPQIIAGGLAVLTLINRGAKLIRLWNYEPSTTLPFTIKADG